MECYIFLRGEMGEGGGEIGGNLRLTGLSLLF